VAAWPAGDVALSRSNTRPPAWTGRAWAMLWIGFAILDLLPGNDKSSTLTADLTTQASSVPSWLAGFDRWLAGGVHHLGPGIGVLLIAAELAIGLLSLTRGRLRPVAIWSGIVLAALYWTAGQSFGQLFSGQATDPSTGPLLMLLGLVTLSAATELPSTQEAAVTTVGAAKAHLSPAS
jgi:hypothetical protein